MYPHDFEIRLLRRIFGSKKEKVIAGDRGTLYNVELRVYASPNIIQTIKSRRMRWMRYVLHMRRKRKAYSILVGKPETKSYQ